uniref:Uncharacterized protein n=1 Tax=Picea sitchensis TaxID=3332 RepID=A0A6B9XQ96_PICSI|nr:hypothetical protein Q903MT_gene2268 [Picea sitchensis]QHR90240.1 hypothetical protein Q903MT_gene4263 [Picea sitchensis]
MGLSTRVVQLGRYELDDRLGSTRLGCSCTFTWMQNESIAVLCLSASPHQ